MNDPDELRLPEEEAGDYYAQRDEEVSHPRTVKELDSDDQPREKAEKYGCGALSTADLWALVLRTGLPGKPITDLCRDIMRQNDGSLHALERRDRREMLKIKGIGKTKAIQIEAVMEIVRRYCAEMPTERVQIRSSVDIDRIMRHEIANLPHEEIWVVLLNRSNHVIGTKKITSGSATASVFDVKAIMKNAILENAEGLILCHNHPSGNLNPSPQDDQITRQCKQAAETLQLRMLDHVILSPAGCYSYADSSRL